MIRDQHFLIILKACVSGGRDIIAIAGSARDEAATICVWRKDQALQASTVQSEVSTSKKTGHRQDWAHKVVGLLCAYVFLQLFPWPTSVLNWYDTVQRSFIQGRYYQEEAAA